MLPILFLLFQNPPPPPIIICFSTTDNITYQRITCPTSGSNQLTGVAPATLPNNTLAIKLNDGGVVPVFLANPTAIPPAAVASIIPAQNGNDGKPIAIPIFMDPSGKYNTPNYPIAPTLVQLARWP